MTINNILGSIIIAALIGASLYLEYGPWPASAEQKARMMEVDRELSTEAANAVFSRECRYKEAIDNAAVEKVVNKIGYPQRVIEN